MIQKLNQRQLVGLGVLFVSLVTYLLTVAPTVSFWDCGEFIACANIMGIPHPPGTPMFMIIGRAAILFFGMFEDIAYRVNLISVLSSAFGVLFAFLFTEKLMALTLKRATDIVTLTAGVVAAMLLNFSDTYWFNAVEAEVYGIAMCIVILMSWLSLLWVENKDNSAGERYLLLIGYLAFFGIGFHLYTVMTFPALFILMLLVDPKMRANWPLWITGILLLSVIYAVKYFPLFAVVLAIYWSIVLVTKSSLKNKYLIAACSSLPILYVVYEWVGLPIFDFSNMSLSKLLIIGLPWVGLLGAEFVKDETLHKRQVSHCMWLCVIALIGFSSYAYIPIRSELNPRIDENNPEINSVMDWESWDTFNGFVERKQYGSRGMLERAMHRRGSIANQVFSHPHMGYGGYMLAQYFPWKVGEGRSRVVDNRLNGKAEFTLHEYDPVQRFGKKFSTQMEIMPPYRSMSFLGFNVPSRLLQIFWFVLFHIPMLWGGYLAYKQNRSMGSYILILYAIASFGLIFYMNFSDGIRPDLDPYEQWQRAGADPSSPPQNVHMEVRERDYFFVPGFVFMSVLFGLSAGFLVQRLRERRGSNSPFAKAVAVSLMVVSGVVPAFSNYYEHDRHKIYIPYDYAKNLLESCLPNSVLFTNGDNDTFPLWFMQEVENVRKDVRVVNLSLANTKWYIDQLVDNEPKLTLGFTKDQIQGLRPQLNPLKEPREHEMKSIGLTVTLDDSRRRPFYKIQDMMVMNIIQNNFPERPIHFAVTVGTGNMMGFQKYMKMDGMVYTLTAEEHKQSLDVERTAYLVDSVYQYRGLKENDFYMSGDTKGLLGNYFATNHQLARWAQGEVVQLRKEVQSLEAELAASPSYEKEESIREKRKEIEEKIAFGEKYIVKTGELMPWDWRHYYFGSQFYAGIEAYAKAETLLNEGLDVNPARADRMLLSLSDVYERQGKYKLSKESLEKFVDAYPNHEYAAYLANRIRQLDERVRTQNLNQNNVLGGSSDSSNLEEKDGGEQ